MSKKSASDQLKIETLFEQELKTLNENLRKQAAIAVFQKLQPSNRISLEAFLENLKMYKDVWSVISAMGVLEFAQSIVGRSKRETRYDLSSTKRTRLSEHQKLSLKEMVFDLLKAHPEGLNRTEIAKTLPLEQIIALGIDARELANKLRQPLGELVKEKAVVTVGAKRLMRYLVSAKQR